MKEITTDTIKEILEMNDEELRNEEVIKQESGAKEESEEVEETKKFDEEYYRDLWDLNLEMVMAVVRYIASKYEEERSETEKKLDAISEKIFNSLSDVSPSNKEIVKTYRDAVDSPSEVTRFVQGNNLQKMIDTMQDKNFQDVVTSVVSKGQVAEGMSDLYSMIPLIYADAQGEMHTAYIVNMNNSAREVTEKLAENPDEIDECDDIQESYDKASDPDTPEVERKEISQVLKKCALEAFNAMKGAAELTWTVAKTSPLAKGAYIASNRLKDSFEDWMEYRKQQFAAWKEAQATEEPTLDEMLKEPPTNGVVIQEEEDRKKMEAEASNVLTRQKARQLLSAELVAENPEDYEAYEGALPEHLQGLDEKLGSGVAAGAAVASVVKDKAVVAGGSELPSKTHKPDLNKITVGGKSAATVSTTKAERRAVRTNTEPALSPEERARRARAIDALVPMIEEVNEKEKTPTLDFEPSLGHTGGLSSTMGFGD